MNPERFLRRKEWCEWSGLHCKRGPTCEYTHYEKYPYTAPEVFDKKAKKVVYKKVARPIPKRENTWSVFIVLWALVLVYDYIDLIDNTWLRFTIALALGVVMVMVSGRLHWGQYNSTRWVVGGVKDNLTGVKSKAYFKIVDAQRTTKWQRTVKPTRRRPKVPEVL